jgi:hypothetical protein
MDHEAQWLSIAIDITTGETLGGHDDQGNQLPFL